MSDTRDDPAVPASSTGLLRAQASWFIDQRSLPRHQIVKAFDEDFQGQLGRLIPQIEHLCDALPPDDVPAKVALACVGAARQRLKEPEAAGLRGEVERVERLARSVVALCDHYDALTGLAMCLACDKPIESGDAWVPYDRGTPCGGAARAGRVHTHCAHAPRGPR
ncbi:DUF6415 family natural product biosynthesis protein [Streptomyces cadmiisoli]|uniref:DUF6415 family natural product biosynthesis protein n=1 Tax=Streptomyces cadmiisoli TaxID=2184053 RepID=UPI003D75E3C7